MSKNKTIKNKSPLNKTVKKISTRLPKYTSKNILESMEDYIKMMYSNKDKFQSIKDKGDIAKAINRTIFLLLECRAMMDYDTSAPPVVKKTDKKVVENE